MLDALVAGERDPKVPANLARGRLRTKMADLREALRGRIGSQHELLIRLSLEHIDQLDRSIAALEAEVDRVIAPFATARDQLDSITGVGKLAAETILAEIGADMSVFPDAAHLASWAGRCPGNNVTGGRRRSGTTRRGSVWLGEILTECAWAAGRNRNTYLGAQFWRLARRIGKKRAAVAVGHSILVIAWHLLTNDADYEDLGGDYFAKRDSHRARSRAISQLEDRRLTTHSAAHSPFRRGYPARPDHTTVMIGACARPGASRSRMLNVSLSRCIEARSRPASAPAATCAVPVAPTWRGKARIARPSSCFRMDESSPTRP
jgi:hypothetical protein